MHTVHLDKSRQVPGGARTRCLGTLLELGLTYFVSKR